MRYEAPEGVQRLLHRLVADVQSDFMSGTVMIDHQTAKDLELVKNAVTHKQMGSLLGMPQEPVRQKVLC